MRHLSFCLGDGVPISWAIKVWHKVNIDVSKSLRCWKELLSCFTPYMKKTWFMEIICWKILSLHLRN